MVPNPSHSDCLSILANPTTQNILERLGYEYSDRGHAEYRKTRPNIIPSLAQAIVAELQMNPIFPPQHRPPEVGVYIHKLPNGFALIDIDKPSVREEDIHPTAEGAARGYVRKVLDDYWLEPDSQRSKSRRPPQ
jgi:hypothetical protein